MVYVLFHPWYGLPHHTLYYLNTSLTNTLLVIPFSLKPDKDVGCHICRFYQDIKHRPDVQNQMEGGGGGGGGGQQIPMQGGPQGWGQGQHQQQYAQGGQPQYK